VSTNIILIIVGHPFRVRKIMPTWFDCQSIILSESPNPCRHCMHAAQTGYKLYVDFILWTLAVLSEHRFCYTLSHK
jgi:hypothetical protein